MIIPAHLNYFGIEECGLYKHSDNKPNALTASETFELIYQWVQGKPMEDTIPWTPVGTKSGMAKCYCHDFYKCEDSEEYIFVLWKSDTDSAGTIMGAQASAKTGSSTVIEHTSNYKGKKMIWGRPCYYWIIPKLNTVISIKTDHSVCDSGLFQEWVTKSITNRVVHANKKKTETESGQVRFEFVGTGVNSTTRYAFRFDIHLLSLNTGNSQLKELASRVTHIIRRDTIKLNSGIDERPEWVKIFDKIPHLPAKPKAKTRQIEVRAEAKPTPAEIKAIIEAFAKEERKRTEWNNVGFATESGIVWVDTYRLHMTVNLDKEGTSVFAASDLHARLSKDRERILAGLKVDKTAKIMGTKIVKKAGS